MNQLQNTIIELETELKLRAYSPNTIRTYRSMLISYLNFHAQADPKNLGEPEIRKWLFDLGENRGVSESYLNQAVNAVKFYYERVLGGERRFYSLPRPRKSKKLPTVLSTTEVKRMIDGIENLKHRAILSTIYSGGLRRGELLNLRIRDMDSDRMLIHIKAGKGKKDRCVMRSDRLLERIRNYWHAYRPKAYLFEGQQGGQYSARSVQQIVKRAARNANIRKNVTTHTLRHSFATQCWKPEPTFGTFRNCWGMEVVRQRRSTHM